MAERSNFVRPVLLHLSAGPGGQNFFFQEGIVMKDILLNVLAFVAFLAVEIIAVAFMSTYPAGSAAMVLLGLLALVIGAMYTALLGRDITNIKL